MVAGWKNKLTVAASDVTPGETIAKKHANAYRPDAVITLIAVRLCYVAQCRPTMSTLTVFQFMLLRRSIKTWSV